MLQPPASEEYVKLLGRLKPFMAWADRELAQQGRLDKRILLQHVARSGCERTLPDLKRMAKEVLQVTGLGMVERYKSLPQVCVGHIHPRGIRVTWRTASSPGRVWFAVRKNARAFTAAAFDLKAIHHTSSTLLPRLYMPLLSLLSSCRQFTLLRLRWDGFASSTQTMSATALKTNPARRAGEAPQAGQLRRPTPQTRS